MARLLFPVLWAARDNDLRSFCFENFRKVYFFMMILPLHSIIDNYFIRGYHLGDQYLQLAILAVVVTINRKDEWIHKSLAIVFLLICATTFGVAWNIFLISG